MASESQNPWSGFARHTSIGFHPMLKRWKMDSKIFDAESFKEFLGDPIVELENSWGLERHYRIEGSKLAAHRDRLATTLYYHHSSFDYAEELKTLGYSRTADILRKYRSGLPRLPETQMGNFAEVIGTEYGKWILGYDTTIVIGKRFNPNVDQSMKGVDILGIRTSGGAELLLGEAKCYQTFSRQSVEASYDHLDSLWKQEFSKLLVFYKEILRLGGDTENEARLDRIFYSGPGEVKQKTLMLVVNQNKPGNPFGFMGSSSANSALPNLLVVHIQVENLRKWVTGLFQSTD
jgi:hypothetical protein